MMRLIGSEWVKVRTVKYWWILFLIGIGLVALTTAPILIITQVAGEEVPELAVTGSLSFVWAQMGSAQVVALIIGILSFTGEYRHGTITDTFLTEPRRDRVIIAKAVVNAALGAVLAVLAAVTVVLLALWLLPQPHGPIEPGDILRTTLATALAYALYAILGVALGALITNQLVAVVVALLWVLVVEQLITVLRPQVAPWLPGGATRALLDSGQPTLTAPADPALLPPAAAAALLVGYAVVLAAVAARTTLRRDIT